MRALSGVIFMWEVICHIHALSVMEPRCNEAKWLAEGPTGGRWQEWPWFLDFGFCHGIGVKTIYMVKLGSCLRTATTAGVRQWAWDSPADGPQFANPSWSGAEHPWPSLPAPRCPPRGRSVAPAGLLRSRSNGDLLRCVRGSRIFISLRWCPNPNLFHLYKNPVKADV